jgi:hypothetical protein
LATGIGFENWTVQPVVRRYTRYTAPDPFWF